MMMSAAPGHLLGQLIGNLLEDALKPELQKLASSNGLFLDFKGPRVPLRTGVKVTWSDELGNTHDLDFVLEHGGNSATQGIPAAFVECAWRRYTKHSKAKAQEISAALDSLLIKWTNYKPIGAAVLAGDWTQNAIAQLTSNGYVVLHFDFPKTVEVFELHGVNIQGEGESTSDTFWLKQCHILQKMTGKQRESLIQDMRKRMSEDLKAFVEELENRVVRKVSRVCITPLHGDQLSFLKISDAIGAVQAYSMRPIEASFIRFEIRIDYTNGDHIEANFVSQKTAIDFMKNFS